MSAKIQVFHAAIKTVVSYAAEVWDFVRYDSVEKLNKYFLKCIFFAPITTPDYALFLESGFSEIFPHTLRLHCNYVQKTINLPANRFPHKVAKEVINKKIFWLKELIALDEKYGTEMKVCNALKRIKMTEWFAGLLPRIEKAKKNQILMKVTQSKSHLLYKKLSSALNENSYFKDSYSINIISTLSCFL